MRSTADFNMFLDGTELFFRNQSRTFWVVSKTKHSKTKIEARSTQISETKHPGLENEAPKSQKRSTQDSKTKHPGLENEAPKTRN